MWCPPGRSGFWSLEVPFGLFIYIWNEEAFVGTKLCKNCASKIPVNAQICPNCGAKVDEKRIIIEEEQEEIREEMKRD